MQYSFKLSNFTSDSSNLADLGILSIRTYKLFEVNHRDWVVMKYTCCLKCLKMAPFESTKGTSFSSVDPLDKKILDKLFFTDEYS